MYYDVLPDGNKTSIGNEQKLDNNTMHASVFSGYENNLSEWTFHDPDDRTKKKLEIMQHEDNSLEYESDGKVNDTDINIIQRSDSSISLVCH